MSAGRQRWTGKTRDIVWFLERQRAKEPTFPLLKTSHELWQTKQAERDPSLGLRNAAALKVRRLDVCWERRRVERTVKGFNVLCIRQKQAEQKQTVNESKEHLDVSVSERDKRTHMDRVDTGDSRTCVIRWEPPAGWTLTGCLLWPFCVLL